VYPYFGGGADDALGVQSNVENLLDAKMRLKTSPLALVLQQINVPDDRRPLSHALLN
jgi:hypothetical protein